MVGQFSQSVTVILSKPMFAVAFLRPLRAECFVFIQVCLRVRTKNRTVVHALHVAHDKGG